MRFSDRRRRSDGRASLVGAGDVSAVGVVPVSQRVFAILKIISQALDFNEKFSVVS